MRNAFLSRLPSNLARAAAGLLLAALVGCNPITPGEWQTSGADAGLGAYTGQLQIRDLGGGNLEVIRLASLEGVFHPDGRAVDTAWTGTASASETGQPLLHFSLTRADFISYVGSLARGAADATALEVTAAVTLGADNALTIHYSASEDPAFSIDEAAIYLGPTGPEPLFVNERTIADSHPEPPSFIRDFLFQLFATYHALPAVQPWTTNPEFQRAVHPMVRERTDLAYYRDNPDRLRVVNKIVDPISLAETEIRANSFRASFRDKAEHYQERVSNHFLASFGMVENYDGDGNPQPDGDGALWTGEYGYTQALRYEATGEAEALADLRSVVRAMMTLMDITGDPLEFARTLRAAGPPLTGGWVHGTGAFAHLDWLAGGNNDMARGLFLGLIAGWDALPADDPLRPEIAAHAQGMLGLCEFSDPRPEPCDEPANPAGLPDGDPGQALIFAGLTSGNAAQIEQGLAKLHDPLLLLYAGIGGGPIYIYGISDWSGNNLTLGGHLTYHWLLKQTADTELDQIWRNASGEGWRVLRTLEMPVHAALAAGLGVLTDPAQQSEATEQAIWGLRSFQFPKHDYAIDHRIRADWVLSPFPSLPWKLDWETEPGRMQSLTGFPMVESSIDHYRWNAGPLDIGGGPSGPDQRPGVDYLFLYWIARDGGLIDADD